MVGISLFCEQVCEESGMTLPPSLAAGTGVDGAPDWRLPAGRRGFGAIGCGNYGVGCRRNKATP